MRKWILLSLVLIVFLGIFVRPALAQEEHILAWPGILPDHPLYRLKMVRDKIWGFLIRDPLKKSQWCLLMADKRIWAAQLLMEKGKFDLAVTTATKAEKYLERAVDRAYQAKDMGGEDNVFFKKMFSASLKHEEVLQEIQQNFPEELRSTIEEILEYPKNVNQKMLMLLSEEQ